MNRAVVGAIAACSIAVTLASPAKGDPQQPDFYQWVDENTTVLCQSLDHFGDSMSTFDQERNWIENQGFSETLANLAMTNIITLHCDDHFEAYNTWRNIRDQKAAN